MTFGSIIFDFFSSSITSKENLTPISDEINISSNSESVSSSIFFPLITFFIFVVIFSEDFESPLLSFLNHPKTIYTST